MSRFSTAGFSLVEAMLVVAMVGILAVLILPRYNKSFVTDLALRSAVSQIAADMRYARSLAITNSGHYLISFDFAQKEYKIYRDSILAANQQGDTKKIADQVFCNGTPQCDFYSLGNAVFLGRLTCRGDAAQSSHLYTINVEQPTGAPLVSRQALTNSGG